MGRDHYRCGVCNTVIPKQEFMDILLSNSRVTKRWYKSRMATCRKCAAVIDESIMELKELGIHEDFRHNW